SPPQGDDPLRIGGDIDGSEFRDDAGPRRVGRYGVASAAAGEDEEGGEDRGEYSAHDFLFTSLGEPSLTHLHPSEGMPAALHHSRGMSLRGSSDSPAVPPMAIICRCLDFSPGLSPRSSVDGAAGALMVILARGSAGPGTSTPAVPTTGGTGANGRRPAMGAVSHRSGRSSNV